MKKESGFGVIPVLLVLVIIAVVGATGWYVFIKSQKSDQKSTKTAESGSPKKSETTQKATNPDETEGWQLVTSNKKAFSIRIPDGWKLTNDTVGDGLISDTQPTSLIYIKGQKAVINEAEFSGTDAPLRFHLRYTDEPYQDWTGSQLTKTEFITNSGLKGARYTETYTIGENGPGPVQGETIYKYQFEKNSKFVNASYRILPGDSDNLQSVELSLSTLTIL